MSLCRHLKPRTRVLESLKGIQNYLGRRLWGSQYLEHILKAGPWAHVTLFPVSRLLAQCRRAQQEGSPLAQARVYMAYSLCWREGPDKELEWGSRNSIFPFSWAGRGKCRPRKRCIFNWESRELMRSLTCSPDFCRDREGEYASSLARWREGGRNLGGVRGNIWKNHPLILSWE